MISYRLPKMKKDNLIVINVGMALMFVFFLISYIFQKVFFGW